MTAKEKAIEIAKKFKGFEMPNEEIASIQCAIIHVKGIIEVLNGMPASNHKYSKLVFYHSVVKELNQM